MAVGFRGWWRRRGAAVLCVLCVLAAGASGHSLSPLEKDTVVEYTRNAYEDWNKLLRQSFGIVQHVERLKSALRQFQPFVGGPLYRIVDQGAASYLSQLTKGSIMRDLAFMSTSRNPNAELSLSKLQPIRYQYVIHPLPKGSMGRDLRANGFGLAKESEVLFYPGTFFCVTDIVKSRLPTPSLAAACNRLVNPDAGKGQEPVNREAFNAMSPQLKAFVEKFCRIERYRDGLRTKNRAWLLSGIFTMVEMQIDPEMSVEEATRLEPEHRRACAGVKTPLLNPGQGWDDNAVSYSEDDYNMIP